MCLLTRQICPAKARKDIPIYKVVVVKMYEGGYNKVQTPVMNMPVQIPGTMNAMGVSVVQKLSQHMLVNKEFKDVRRIVEGGFIHAFYDLDAAKRMCRFVPMCTSTSLLFPNEIKQFVLIVTGIIKKGTLYYKGDKVSGEIAAKSVQLFEDGLLYTGTSLTTGVNSMSRVTTKTRSVNIMGFLGKYNYHNVKDYQAND